MRLIACGGIALTLLGFKDSTKDIDLMVPDNGEYDYLVRMLEDLGYRRIWEHSWKGDDLFIFDIYVGNCIHTTELLESPLIPGNHELIREFSRIYLGALNDYDLIISKLFRGARIDIDDCLMLPRRERREDRYPGFRDAIYRSCEIPDWRRKVPQHF